MHLLFSLPVSTVPIFMTGSNRNHHSDYEHHQLDTQAYETSNIYTIKILQLPLSAENKDDSHCKNIWFTITYKWEQR